MPKTVKTLLLFTILLLNAVFSNAQLKLPVASPAIADLKKVVADYPNQYMNLIGDEIANNPQSVDYRCNFVFHDADYAQFSKYSSDKGAVMSFEAQIMQTDNFDKARQKFHNLCNQLNNLSMSAGAAGNFKLKGDYEAPVEEKKFNSVQYVPQNGGMAVQNLRLEVVMEADLLDWKVKLLVYDHQRDDASRGPAKEGGE